MAQVQQVEAKKMTLDEVKQLNPDEQPGELVRGVFLPMSRPTIQHGRLMARIARLIGNFVETKMLGEVIVGDSGFVLDKEEQTLRGPDVAFISKERIPSEGLPDDWWEGAPDLAVEIVSRSQTAHELARKALDYLQAGTKIVWVVDPESKTVAVYTPPNHIRILREDETLDGGDVLPEFKVQVKELFGQ
ncbi:MAG: Uma2 family endonuclease [Armatimonadetes bacterium]|nr:Uma2 family endonuclease [Armatimonadota bacterium]MCX7969036.1 Uma2 family endonuclease [Armatimonadota bacterium]MDW8142878.1 Uma2 family endonuclease [Armatimonadota bacterium]